MSEVPVSVAMCEKCGREPVHEDSWSGKCRRCSEKGGDNGFVTRIDNDKLRARLGRELAKEILETCGVGP